MLVPLEHAAPCLPIISFKPVAVPAAESYLDDRGEKLRSKLASSLTAKGKGIDSED